VLRHLALLLLASCVGGTAVYIDDTTATRAADGRVSVSITISCGDVCGPIACGEARWVPTADVDATRRAWTETPLESDTVCTDGDLRASHPMTLALQSTMTFPSGGIDSIVFRVGAAETSATPPTSWDNSVTVPSTAARTMPSP
jgi:hypothetical protein